MDIATAEKIKREFRFWISSKSESKSFGREYRWGKKKSKKYGNSAPSK